PCLRQGGIGGAFTKATVCRNSSHEGKIRKVVTAAIMLKNWLREPSFWRAKRHFEPIDSQGILAVAQRNAAKPAVTVDGAVFAPLDRFFARGKLRSGKIFLDRRVGGGLARKDEMAAGGRHRLAQRLARE